MNSKGLSNSDIKKRFKQVAVLIGIIALGIIISKSLSAQGFQVEVKGLIVK